MKKQIESAIEWIKEQDHIKGVITGSCLLDYFEGQDVDIFLYDKESFTKLFYAMYYNDMFQLSEEGEEWKATGFMESGIPYKLKIFTVKFRYNTCIPINIIFKEGKDSIYNVLASFDMSIVCKGFDLQTKQSLDITNGSDKTKIASWNRYNTNYYDPRLWQANMLLRQVSRIVKYYKRGYNTDPLAEKYIEIIDDINKLQNIFKSNKFEEILDKSRRNTKLIKSVLKKWLETHEITNDGLELLETKMREI
jgi:hypothetical protein